jgi:hypothetical protein
MVVPKDAQAWTALNIPIKMQIGAANRRRRYFQDNVVRRLQNRIRDGFDTDVMTALVGKGAHSHAPLLNAAVGKRFSQRS